MFLYNITRPAARLACRVYFKKLYFSFPDRIPVDKPVMLAVNHPTPFLDPCVLAAFLPNPLYSLTRGDFFKKRLYRWLLEQYNMIPIYRFRDGFTDLKQNARTFQNCYKAWGENKTIVIFSEGNCVVEKRLRSIQKGTARMAFGVWENYPDLDLYIVPVGVNHTYPDRFREEAMYEFGEPIRVMDYKHQYEEHPVRAVNQLTAELSRRMSDLVIIIDQAEDEELVEILFQVYRNNRKEPVFPLVSGSNQRLQDEKKIASIVNNMPAGEKEELKKTALLYHNMLNDNRLNDEAVARPDYYTPLNTLYLVLGVIPFIAGFISHIFPFLLAKYITDKFVKDKSFYSSVLFSTGLFVFLCYYFLMLVGFVLVVNNKAYIIVSITLVVCLTGFFSVLYSEHYLKWAKSKRYARLLSEVRQQILDLRFKLISILNQSEIK